MNGYLFILKDARDAMLVQELRIRQHQLVQSAKMASLGELSGGIAHELNNPLSIIEGYAEIARDLVDEMDEELAGPMAKYLNRIQENAERMATIVAHIRDFSRIDDTLMVPASVNKVVRASFRLVEQQLYNRGIDLDINYADDDPVTLGDEVKLQHAFVNIIANARDAICEIHKGRGGRFTVTVKAEGEYILVEFTDNGSGIEKEHLDRIFDPFYTTRDVGKGTGLGLSAAHGILADHGGIITCTSGPAGSTFVVKLKRHT